MYVQYLSIFLYIYKIERNIVIIIIIKRRRKKTNRQDFDCWVEIFIFMGTEYLGLVMVDLFPMIVKNVIVCN